MTRRTLLLSPSFVFAQTAKAQGSLAQGVQADKPRWRDLAPGPGVYPTGPWNAITDVEGVRVGHLTLVEGARIRTGVTAILPHGGNFFQNKVAGNVFVANAFGKLAGSTQVQELGTIETPILLTNTLAVGLAVDALVRYTLAQAGNENVRSVNALVGETNDGQLNDIRSLPLKTEHFLRAIADAKTGPVAEGSVGAGTGTVCFGWKGGIGTASRRTPQGWTLGVLLQSNFGGYLTMGGVPVHQYLSPPERNGGDGSCMIVVATNAPLTSRDLQRLAARAAFGIARTGSAYTHGSGDYAIAFSTNREAPTASERLSPLFEAALEATEEAVYNSLLQARVTPPSSSVRPVEELPLERLRPLLASLRPK
ncbi:MAG: P1 family peptidase [Bryobacter sp.]|nr:P1 family peptidase [Bryobacter sp.]